LNGDRKTWRERNVLSSAKTGSEQCCVVLLEARAKEFKAVASIKRSESKAAQPACPARRSVVTGVESLS